MQISPGGERTSGHIPTRQSVSKIPQQTDDEKTMGRLAIQNLHLDRSSVEPSTYNCRNEQYPPP